ncbi:Hypothetical protein SCF082_LOCUS50652 [Durusdinium trenchii]|uniref:Uncharacterized protein n=1 Tax=Durusdinium trenchii TaxID=1381693 RepID=A0ABP0S9E7_9DINO
MPAFQEGRVGLVKERRTSNSMLSVGGVSTGSGSSSGSRRHRRAKLKYETAADCPGFVFDEIYGFQGKCKHCKFPKMEHPNDPMAKFTLRKQREEEEFRRSLAKKQARRSRRASKRLSMNLRFRTPEDVGQRLDDFEEEEEEEEEEEVHAHRRHDQRTNEEEEPSFWSSWSSNMAEKLTSFIGAGRDRDYSVEDSSEDDDEDLDEEDDEELRQSKVNLGRHERTSAARSSSRSTIRSMRSVRSSMSRQHQKSVATSHSDVSAEELEMERQHEAELNRRDEELRLEKERRRAEREERRAKKSRSGGSRSSSSSKSSSKSRRSRRDEEGEEGEGEAEMDEEERELIRLEREAEAAHEARLKRLSQSSHRSSKKRSTKRSPKGHGDFEEDQDEDGDREHEEEKDDATGAVVAVAAAAAATATAAAATIKRSSTRSRASTKRHSKLSDIAEDEEVVDAEEGVIEAAEADKENDVEEEEEEEEVLKRTSLSILSTLKRMSKRGSSKRLSKLSDIPEEEEEDDENQDEAKDTIVLTPTSAASRRSSAASKRLSTASQRSSRRESLKPTVAITSLSLAAGATDESEDERNEDEEETEEKDEVLPEATEAEFAAGRARASTKRKRGSAVSQRLSVLAGSVTGSLRASAASATRRSARSTDDTSKLAAEQGIDLAWAEHHFNEDSEDEFAPDTASQEEMDAQLREWVGRPVRAMYEDDECFYEAEIVEYEGDNLFTVLFKKNKTIQRNTEKNDIQLLTEEEEAKYMETQESAAVGYDDRDDSIWQAAKRGDQVALEHFIKKGEDISRPHPAGSEDAGKTPLFLACTGDNEVEVKRVVVKRLLQAGAEDEDGAAYIASDAAIRKVLVDYGMGKAGNGAQYYIRKEAGEIEAVDVVRNERKHRSTGEAKKAKSTLRRETKKGRGTSWPMSSASADANSVSGSSTSSGRSGIRKMLCFAGKP